MQATVKQIRSTVKECEPVLAKEFGDFLVIEVRKLEDETNKGLHTVKCKSLIDPCNGSTCREDGTRGKKLCPLCDLYYPTFKKIEEHLIDAHGSILTIEELEFSSYEEFKIWKCQEEAQTGAQYSTRTSKSNRNQHMYQCHRSGHQRIQGRGAKQRRKPTEKINRCCPARIITTLVGKKLKVLFHKTHFGHNEKTLRLSEEQRGRYEELISKKVTMDNILKDVRLSTQSKSEVKLRTVLRRDECHPAGVEPFSCFVPENQPLDEWIKDQVIRPDNCVRSYRSKTHNYAHNRVIIDAVEDGELFLVLMSNRQSEVISNIEPKNVVLDCCRGVTDHTYEVATLILVDEFANGCPIAFCFASNICAKILSRFYSTVKDSHGTITANIFMSADEPGFYESWTSVMGRPEHTLLSSWDVEKQWRDALNNTVGLSQLSKIEIYHACCVLLERMDLDGFCEDLTTFSAMCREHPETVEFGDYFNKTYANRPELWAFCYRMHSNIKDHKLELLHRRLQFCYRSSGSHVHRKIGICINKLLKFGDEVLLARAIRKGRKPAKIADSIALNHRKSEVITTDMIAEKAENVWSVGSGSDVETVCVTPEIQCSCQHSCIACGHCLHQFSCTCSAYLRREEFCEHAHACFVRASIERRKKLKRLRVSLSSTIGFAPQLSESGLLVVQRQMQVLYDLTKLFVQNKMNK